MTFGEDSSDIELLLEDDGVAHHRDSGNSWMFANRVPRICAGDCAPHNAVDIFVQDLGIVQEKAAQEHFPLALTQLDGQRAGGQFGRDQDLRRNV